MSRKLSVNRGNNVLFEVDLNPDDEVQLARTAERGWNILVSRPVAGDGLVAGLEQVTAPVTEVAGLEVPAEGDKASMKARKTAAKKTSTAKRTAKKKEAKK